MPVYDSFISSYRIPQSRRKTRLHILLQTYGRNPHRGSAGRTSVEMPIDGARHSRPTERRPDKNNDGRGRFRSNRIEIRKPEVFSVNPIRQPDPTHGHRKKPGRKGTTSGNFSYL